MCVCVGVPLSCYSVGHNNCVRVCARVCARCSVTLCVCAYVWGCGCTHPVGVCSVVGGVNACACVCVCVCVGCRGVCTGGCARGVCACRVVRVRVCVLCVGTPCVCVCVYVYVCGEGSAGECRACSGVLRHVQHQEQPTSHISKSIQY